MLALSRTSKDLSGLLMTESAASVWRTARENVPDIPPCLSDLNEAQYANLLFCNYCHVSRSTEVLTSLLIRYVLLALSFSTPATHCFLANQKESMWLVLQKEVRSMTL